MTRQNPLTLFTPVKQDQVGALITELQKIRQEMERGIRQPFEDLGTIHYARWVLLYPKDIDRVYETSPGIRLVFSSDFDGSPDMHIAGLASDCAAFIDRLYTHCEGYPEAAGRTPQGRKQYLRQWKVLTSAFYAGAPGCSLKQIRLESGLRDHIWKFLSERKWKDYTPSQVFGEVKKKVDGQPEFQWVKEKSSIPSPNPLGIGLLGLVLLALSPLILVWIGVIRLFHEPKDPPLGLTPSQIEESHLKILEEYEDLHNQNQFTQVLAMKPGAIRLIMMQSMMIFARVLIKNAYVKGKLMGIPTIHFARWVMFDDQKAIIFFSNFDGSWQQYLGDFIDKSGWGLTGIFSNTVKFPKTRFLFWGGAYDEEHFLAWSRFYQIPTQVWYCAYPQLSIKNINNNSAIRRLLGKKLNDREAQAFLNRF